MKYNRIKDNNRVKVKGKFLHQLIQDKHVKANDKVVHHKQLNDNHLVVQVKDKHKDSKDKDNLHKQEQLNDKDNLYNQDNEDRQLGDKVQEKDKVKQLV